MSIYTNTTPPSVLYMRKRKNYLARKNIAEITWRNDSPEVYDDNNFMQRRWSINHEYTITRREQRIDLVIPNSPACKRDKHRYVQHVCFLILLYGRQRAEILIVPASTRLFVAPPCYRHPPCLRYASTVMCNVYRFLFIAKTFHVTKCMITVWILLFLTCKQF